MEARWAAILTGWVALDISVLRPLLEVFGAYHQSVVTPIGNVYLACYK